jgi:hypothetical protein
MRLRVVQGSATDRNCCRVRSEWYGYDLEQEELFPKAITSKSYIKHY